MKKNDRTPDHILYSNIELIEWVDSYQKLLNKMINLTNGS